MHPKLPISRTYISPTVHNRSLAASFYSADLRDKAAQRYIAATRCKRQRSLLDAVILAGLISVPIYALIAIAIFR